MLALAGAAILTCGSADAQSSGRSRCGWVARGVYACESVYETPYSKTYTLCGSGGIDSACTTKTTRKDGGPPSQVGRAPNGDMIMRHQ
jgi:hypothetical protein